MYKKTILDNGLRVVTEEKSGFNSVTIGIWVEVGSGYELKKLNGISHFIEHMLFKGTKTKTAKQIAEIMDGVGGQLNAFTEKEHTCYYARVAEQYIDMASELLFDLIQNPLLEHEDIERERNVILNEIAMDEDDPEGKIFELFSSQVWKSHPLERPILGRVRNVKAIQREDLLKYMAEHYSTENMIIAAAGSVSHDQFVKICQKYAKSLRNNGKKTDLAPVPEYKKSSILKKKRCEQSYIILGRNGVAASDPSKYALFIVDNILGSAMSSRLFQEIREKRGLAYTVESFTSTLSKGGTFGLFAGTSPESLQEVKELLLSITEKFKKEGPTDEEIQRAKLQIKGSLTLLLENSAERMLKLAKSELYYGRNIPLEEIFELTDRVTPEDISQISDKFLDTSLYSEAIITPRH